MHFPTHGPNYLFVIKVDCTEVCQCVNQAYVTILWSTLSIGELGIDQGAAATSRPHACGPVTRNKKGLIP